MLIDPKCMLLFGITGTGPTWVGSNDDNLIFGPWIILHVNCQGTYVYMGLI